VGGRGHKERVRAGEMVEYVVFLYERRTIKLVEIVLRSGRVDERERWRG
jgi:hypothetical protein